jgi:outer membrane protein assembly factor BamB
VGHVDCRHRRLALASRIFLLNDIRMKRLRLITALLLSGLSSVAAADWPQFLGPDRNNMTPAPTPTKAWPKSGPPKAWEHRVGTGWSGPVVQDGRVIIFHRQEGREIVDCLATDTGKSLWQFTAPTAYVDGFGFDNGPRSTPAIANGNVYLFGADGNLHCLKLSDGRKLWSTNLLKTLDASKGFFGLACSPLIHGNSVLLNIGAPDGAGIVAINAATGRLNWKSISDEASYASPVLQTFTGTKRALFLTRENLVSLDPLVGKPHWQMKFSPAMQASVSASVPVVSGHTVFTTASYGAGAIALEVNKNGFDQVWANDSSLSCQYHTPVLKGGYLYGFHGRLDTGPRPEFRCVELKTGAVKWKQPRVDAGAIIQTASEALIVTVNGGLLRGRLSPSGFTETGRTQILGFEVRAHPAFADSKLFARDKNKLVAIDLQ